MLIADALKGTREYEIISDITNIYARIEYMQQEWKLASGIICPEGCGFCCVAFEPEVFASEALYLAAWLLEYKEQTANDIGNGTFISARPQGITGCFLFTPDSYRHCTVYEGRCLICRLFGYSGDYGKDAGHRWKPCRFYPAEKLMQHIPPLEHRQYLEQELNHIFGSLPPAMSDNMEQAMAISPGAAGTPEPLRVALPTAIRKLKMIMEFNNNGGNDNEPLSA